MNAHLSSAVFLSAGLVAQAQDFALDNLPALHNFQSHRITSADPTGKNDDWRRLEPGQTLVLAEISDPAPRAFPPTAQPGGDHCGGSQVIRSDAACGPLFAPSDER